MDVPVTSQPSGLFPGGYNGALTLFNNDTADTVYVGETGPTCVQGQGLPLPPRASTQWDSGRPLWLSAPLGTPSAPVVVSVVSNQGTVFSPADIAAQIIAQGLTPLAIANAIVASALATNTGTQTATQVALSGAPPIDLPATLTNNSQVINSGANGVTIGPLDVTKYQSIEIQLNETGATANTNVTSLSVSWFADVAATIGIFTSMYLYGTFNGQFGLRTPIPRGAKSVKIARGSAVTTTAVTCNTLVLGSMFAVPASSFYNDGNAGLGTPAPSVFRTGQLGLWAITSGTNVVTTTWRPSSFEGQATLGILCLGATGANKVDVVDRLTGIPIASVLLPTTTTIGFVPGIILPRGPVNVVWTNSGTVTGLNIALTMTPWSA